VSTPILKRLFSSNSYTCARLLSLHPPDLDYLPVDVQLNDFIRDVLQKPPVEETKFRGYAETAVFALLYLLRRNASECVVLSNFRRLADKLLLQKVGTLDDIPFLEWSDIGFSYSDSTLEYPGGRREKYLEGMKTCLGMKGTRFVINVMTLISQNGSAHANIVLYDRVMHVVERFDPYQVQLPGMDLPRLDRELEKLFREVDPDLQDFLSPPDINFFARHGLQLEQESEDEMNYLDPVGFCMPWTILYADTRLSFPDQDPRSIPDLYRKAVADDNSSLTAFIRNYTDHLFKTSFTIFNRYLDSKEEYEDYDDARVPMLAIMLQQLSIYKTVMT